MGLAVQMVKWYGKEMVRINSGQRGMSVVAPSNHSVGQSGKLIEQRRQARLCFKCDDRYYPRHQCKRQLLLLEGEDGMMDEEEEIEEAEELEGDDNREISLYALTGLINNKIIKVERKVQEGNLMILIDSGSTHNLLDESTAKKLHCRLTRTQPLRVIITNGKNVLSKSTCTGFCWEM